jgi:hypothetical protein
MCAQQSDCGAQAACVAGRCVAHGATPAVDSARRLVFAPVDVGYVEPDGAPRDTGLATLGRAHRPAMTFLRFSVPLPADAEVLEAYVLLQRATGVDADATPIALHAARVVTRWDTRSLSWATQPHVEEVGAPVTRVSSAAGPLVRVDVRDIVQRWRKRVRDELGVAIVAEGESVTGVAFALSPSDVAHGGDDPILSPQSAPSQPGSPFESHAGSAVATAVGEPMRQLEGPRLELYVK